MKWLVMIGRDHRGGLEGRPFRLAHRDHRAGLDELTRPPQGNSYRPLPGDGYRRRVHARRQLRHLLVRRIRGFGEVASRPS